MDKVYRCSHPNAGTKAAQWAKKHYENSDSEYLVTFNLKSETFTYCTKIIYQAYKYGVDKNSVSDHGLYIISPYALTDNFTDEYKLKLVKYIKNPDGNVNLCSYFTPPLGFIVILL